MPNAKDLADGLLKYGKDFAQSASNSVAGNLSFPVDAIAWALRKTGVPVGEAPVGGSDWMQQKGFTRPVDQNAASILGETAGGVLAPIMAYKAPQIAGALLQIGENAAAPTTLNKQSGAILLEGKKLPDEIAKKRLLGFGHLPKDDRYDSAGNLYEDMQKKIIPLSDGNFLAQQTPSWMSKQKPLYLVADNLEEAISRLNSKAAKSDNAVTSEAARKYNESLAGMLEKEYGKNAFTFSNSDRSASEYITHVPSGQKIRISDHNLPLGYVSPNLDLRNSMNKQELFLAIKKYLDGD